MLTVYLLSHVAYRLPPSGFIEPCLPSPAERPPNGPGWLHEIKLDGLRLMARRGATGVRLLTRNGIDWSFRFPLIVQAVGALRARSCLFDGEAVCCGGNGVASFDLIRHHRHNDRVFLYAFDLIGLNGDDMPRDPLEVRKATMIRPLGAGRSANPKFPRRLPCCCGSSLDLGSSPSNISRPLLLPTATVEQTGRIGRFLVAPIEQVVDAHLRLRSRQKRKRYVRAEEADPMGWQPLGSIASVDDARAPASPRPRDRSRIAAA